MDAIRTRTRGAAVAVFFGVLCGLLAVGPAMVLKTEAQNNTAVYFEQGGATLVLGSGGKLDVQSGATLEVDEGATVTFAESQSFTLGADEKVLVDGATTAQTQTAGALDINLGTVTADVSGLNLTATTNSGAASGTDTYAAIVTLTQNDADADARGIKIDAAATANAAAGSYEYGIAFDCAEDTAGACLDGILITSSGVASALTDAIDASAANIVNAISIGANLILGDNSDSLTVGATDNTVTFTVDGTNTATITGADAAGAADTVYDTTGAGAITVGSADVTSVSLLADADVQLKNGATGNVDLSFHDYADSADDDMAHVLLRANCTDATTGAEDCDFTVGVAEAGAAAETRISVDADGGVEIGSANNNSVSLTTDGTGDGEVVLPTGAVSTGEVLDGTLLAADDAFGSRGVLQICGDLVTINNNTVYYGPNRTVVATTASGMTCDTAAAGNVTEATADAPALEATAFHVLGMICRTVDTNASVSFTLRSAEAATTPSVTCTTTDNQLDCAATQETTTQVASGATLAVAAASTSDVGTAAFVCNISIAY